MTTRVYSTTLIATAVLTALACSTTTHQDPSVRADAPTVADAAAVRSYIVEGASGEGAASAVEAAGGQVVSTLGVIDAVEATLTDAQLARVRGTSGIKQVTDNATVTTQAAAFVRDNFETGSFANNDGTHRW